MKFIVDPSMEALGVSDVVIGIARNVDPNAPLTDAFLNKMKEKEEWACNADISEVEKHPFIQGYKDIIANAKRSLKKNPPTIPAFINNIKRRGQMPRINSIVDIYNVESLNSFLAIGGHDADKIDEFVEFTVSNKEDEFTPICAHKKHVAETDFVYRDAKGIIAWLGVRDSEFYKFDDDTRTAFFAIQGNANTPVQDRIDCLNRIFKDLKECMPNLETEIVTVHAGETKEI